MGFSVQRRKEAIDVGGSRLTVGSHATCDLVLDDPIAASLHVLLSLGPRGVTVEPQPTATGTFLDSELIKGATALPVGSELVVGTSRLKLESFDAGSSHAAFGLAERSFFHVEKKRGVFRSDADEAVRSEVRFGRFKSLRGINALVILGLLALVGGWAFGAFESWQERGRVWASPGVLAGLHHPGFSGVGDGEQLAGWSPAQRAHAKNGCAACHVDGQGDYAGNVSCAGCHDDMLSDLRPQGRHPFKGADAVNCQGCHRIHGGNAPLRGVEFHGQECGGCHKQSSADLSQLLAQVEGSVIGAPTPRSLGNAGFRHEDHADLESRNCITCHEVDAEGKHYSMTGGAELCFGCHGDEARLAADRATRGLVGERPTPVTLTLAEHESSEALCVDCHGSVQNIQPPVATLVPPSGTVALGFRLDSHHHHGDQKCSECHLKPLRKKPEGHVPSFAHALHTGLDCRGCHYRPDTPAGLPTELVAETWEQADLEASCIDCHRGADGQLLVAFEPKERAAEAFDRTGHARFSHDLHSAAHTCSDCHVVPDGEEAGRVVRSARDCASCHYDADEKRHRIPAKVEECSRCHPSVGAGEEAAGHSLADLFLAPSADRVEGRSPRAGSLFNHALSGHADLQCAQCHGWSGRDGGALAVEGAQRDRCRKCHQNQRFHWR